MLLIRPVDVTEDNLTASNMADFPSPWFGDVTYDEGDLVSFGQTPVSIANSANTTVVDLGAGVYTIEKTSGADTTWNAGANASFGFSGDFVLRAKRLAGNDIAIGLNADPTAGNTNADIDLHLYARSVPDWLVYTGTQQLYGSFTGQYAYLWRRGEWVFAGAGDSFEEASAAPVWSSENWAGQTLYVDAAFYRLAGKVEVIAMALNEWPAQRIATYRSLEAANLANDPADSPSSWALGAYVYTAWEPSIVYGEGDKAIPREARLVAEHSFNFDLEDWSIVATGTGSAAWKAGGFAHLQVTNSADICNIYKSFPTVPGRRYRLTVDVAAYSGGSGWYVYVVSPSTYVVFNILAPDSKSGEFIATLSSTQIELQVSGWTNSLTQADFTYFKLEELVETGEVYEAFAGASAITPITIASPGVVTFLNHGAADGTPVVFLTNGALPTGLVAGTVYYVKDPAQHTFKLAATVGGSAINTSGSQSGVHRATLNPNIGNDPLEDDGSNWLLTGPTNKWAMFDNVAGTFTADPTTIDFTVEPGARVDALALLNVINAATVQVIMTVSPDGVVYDETFDMTSSGPIFDWYSYFSEPIELSRALLVADLPSYSGPSVQVIISGGDVSVGVFTIGRAFDLGRALHDGAQVGITDYSRKEADDFGNYSIVERAFAKRGSFQTLITAGQVDAVHAILADYRATPAVYSASADYDATLIFGFFRDFQIEIAYPNESFVSIEIEGLI